MFSRLSATKKGMILVLVPVVFELVFFASIYALLNRASDSFNRLHTSRRGTQLLLANELSFGRIVLSMSRVGSKSEEILNALDRAVKEMSQHHAWKGVNPNLNPELRAAMEQGRKLREEFMTLYEQGVTAAQAGPKAIKLWSEQVGMMTAFQLYSDQRQLSRMISEIERKAIEAQPEELHNTRSSLMLLLGIGLTVSTLLSLGLAFLFTHDIAQRLSSIISRAHLLAVGKLQPSQIEGTDEIAELDAIITDAGRTLNQARAREAIVLDKAADVLCSIDANMRFTNVGEASKMVWHFEPDELLGLSFLTMLSEDSVERTRALFYRLQEENAQNNEERLENIIKCKDGARKNSIWTVNWSPERREYFCVVHDVSELRAVEKLKQHFLSVASHDLRAPLSAVSINVSMLLEGKKGAISEAAVKELNRVQTSVNRLTELVGELLELEKLEAGKLSLDLTAVSASDVCEAAKELLLGLAQKSSVTIRGPIGEALICAEEKRMVQMIVNLLSNAIKFSPQDREDAAVTISIVKTAEYAEIRITDQGPGIAPEDRALIFEKFRQTRTAETVSQKGTGLGLAIVRALAESHGGAVGIDSELGKGSTFYVRVPLWLESDEEMV